LLNEFAISPAADSTFEVTPGVKIIGDGTQTSEAVARAIVNETGNTIQRIEMLNLGGGYKYATASVLAHNSVAVTQTANANVLGHRQQELLCVRIMLTIQNKNYNICMYEFLM
jgi:hypothetical protein